MATITYNGGTQSQIQNYVTFTDFPNILRIEDNVSTFNAYIDLEVHATLKNVTTGDSQWYITLFGDTITNVMNPQNAVNKNFCVLSNGTSTAASIAKALRNCPNIAANFTVHTNSNTVTLEAMDGGEILGQDFYASNISSTYLEVDAEDGSGSELIGSQIGVDVYSDNVFITTLEKTFYGKSCEFNMTPVLTTLADYGKTVPYNFNVNLTTKEGEYSRIGYMSNNYITYGYLCNQGYGVIQLTNTPYLAQNVSRGESRGYTNNTRLYTYFPFVQFSFYMSGDTYQNFTVNYMDSAMNTIHSGTTIENILGTDINLHDVQINFDEPYFSQAFYIGISTNGFNLLYEVIKPLKAAEGAQRIYWRNSYGGISFIDLTGQRSETRSLENTTYSESIYDSVNETIRAYKNGNVQNVPYYALNKVYNTKVDYKVTLKSHLFEEDGKWIYNDLVQSSKVWTEINGKFYEIILDSVSVEEQNNNGIYEATVVYRYSQIPSEIQ